MKTNDITKDYKGLLIGIKNEYPSGQILYDGDEWVYINSVNIISIEANDYTPHKLVQYLLDNNIIDNIMFITYDGKNAN